MINYRIVTNVLGAMLLLFGGLMLTGLVFSWYYESGDGWSLVQASGISIVVGGAMWAFSRMDKHDRRNNFHKKEGYLIVALGWIAMSSCGALPYWLSGIVPTFTDAYFESISGLTTTGASILNDIEAVPKGLLFWRSLTQWIGGMGIIVLTVAILPLLGIGGVELFSAEAPGPTSDKLHPRIRETAKRLWLIYVGLTILLTLILWAEGMCFYDAINHGLTTMATGGFSTKNNSMMYWDNVPLIQYTIVLFMFFAGTNYAVLYFGLKGRFNKVWNSTEFRAYAVGTGILTIFLTIAVYFNSDLTLEKSFRDVIFQILSIITTTGFVSADYTSWAPFITMIFFVLLFLGACAGSTSGGIKLIRHVVLVKHTLREFRRLLKPRAILPIRVNQGVVSPNIVANILVFLLLYILIFVISTIIMVAIGLDFETAVGAVATSLGNVGPGIGEVGPVDNFAWLPDRGKWFLSFLMMLGRLELVSILILFTPYFWRR